MKLNLSFFLASILLAFIGCNSPDKETNSSVESLMRDSSLKFAKRFSISYSADFTYVYLFGNRNNYDTTSTFILYTDSSKVKKMPTKATVIKSPCKNIAALSSIYATMLCELGMINSITAIDNIDYVNNLEIISKHNARKLKELARTPELDLEQTVTLNPDIIFTFGMGDGKKNVDEKLTLTKIPVAISVDHLEESPLARAEWIKFFAAFVGKKQKADSIFKEVEKNYFTLKNLSETIKEKPTVFNEIKYGDTWYMPGGKSYVALLLKDAGANYLWNDNADFGSLPLSFEQVYAKAKNADYWIHLSSVKTKKELLSFESRYSEFKAFKKGTLYNNTKVTNSKGYSTYWETGMIHPDRILNDLILIFHPELKEKMNTDFYYYEQIN